MSVLQGYLKGVLLKKQLIASFVEQFKLNLENTRAPLVEHLMTAKQKSVDSFLFCKIITIPYCVSKRVGLDSSSES